LINLKLSIVVAGIWLAALSGSSCNDSKKGSPVDSGVAPAVDGGTKDTQADGTAAGSTLTIDVTDVGARYAGALLYVSVTAGTVSCEGVTGPSGHTGGGMVIAGECKVAIGPLAAGTYTACAFIDADNNMQPSPGDLVGQLSLDVSGDDIETWSATDWFVVDGATDSNPITGPYKVGYRELILTDSTRGRSLTTAFWYPTVDGQDGATRAVDRGTPDLSGRPYPLIVYSHGDCSRSTNGQADFLKNAWAAQGFIVVAPDHKGNTTYDCDDAVRASIQFDRPLDLRFVTDQVLLLAADTSSFLFGMVDPNAIGVSGHSFGGHTTVMVSGATPNLDHLAATCKVSPDSWDVCPLQDKLQQLYPGQRVIDLSDSRMKAALALAPDGYGWFLADGMAKIKKPMMIMAGRLDTICPLDSQAMPEYQGLVSTRYLFIMDKADHMAFGNQCSQSTFQDCPDLHQQITTVSIDFWKLHLKSDLQAVDRLHQYVSAHPDTTLLE
jgi:predicted dienelactone hydrolase